MTELAEVMQQIQFTHYNSDGATSGSAGNEARGFMTSHPHRHKQQHPGVGVGGGGVIPSLLGSLF